MVFALTDTKSDRLLGEEYRPPFDDIFNLSGPDTELLVEVAGIEPASFGYSAWLLRVQLVVNCRNPATASAWQDPYLVGFHPNGTKNSVGLSLFDRARYHS